MELSVLSTADKHVNNARQNVQQFIRTNLQQPTFPIFISETSLIIVGIVIYIYIRASNQFAVGLS